MIAWGSEGAGQATEETQVLVGSQEARLPTLSLVGAIDVVNEGRTPL